MEIEELIAKFREEFKQMIIEGKNPVDELEGMLAHVKNKTSVQLQHEASKYRTEIALSYLKKRK